MRICALSDAPPVLSARSGARSPTPAEWRWVCSLHAWSSRSPVMFLPVKANRGRRSGEIDDRHQPVIAGASAEGQGGQESAWRLMVGPGEGVTEGGILAGEKQPEVDHVLRQEVLVL